MNRTLSGDVQFSNGELGISQCVWCRHRSVGGQRCSAFPSGIPVAILRNEHDHRTSFAGDNGVLFEPEEVEIEVIDIDDETDVGSMNSELSLENAPSTAPKTGT